MMVDDYHYDDRDMLRRREEEEREGGGRCIVPCNAEGFSCFFYLVADRR